MNVLLDTHVLLWWMSDDVRLPSRMRSRISDPRTTALVSAASVWEMSIKAALGRLRVPDDHLADLEREGFEGLPIDADDALAAGALARHHDDPFDRMLIAQARRRDLLLLSVDRIFELYDVRLLRD